MLKIYQIIYQVVRSRACKCRWAGRGNALCEGQEWCHIYIKQGCVHHQDRPLYLLHFVGLLGRGTAALRVRRREIFCKQVCFLAAAATVLGSLSRSRGVAFLCVHAGCQLSCQSTTQITALQQVQARATGHRKSRRICQSCCSNPSLIVQPHAAMRRSNDSHKPDFHSRSCSLIDEPRNSFVTDYIQTYILRSPRMMPRSRRDASKSWTAINYGIPRHARANQREREKYQDFCSNRTASAL